MALNKLQQLDKEQLIKVIRDSGYIDIANILKKQDVNGNTFLNIREFEILNWECTPLMIKKMINFTKEFKKNPSILQLSSVDNIPRRTIVKSPLLSKRLVSNFIKNPSPKIPPAVPKRKETPIVIERPSSLPNENMENILPLPTNDSDRQIKSLNDLRHDIANKHNYISELIERQNIKERSEVVRQPGFWNSKLHQENLSNSSIKGNSFVPSQNIRTDKLNHHNPNLTESTWNGIHSKPFIIPQSTGEIPKLGYRKVGSSGTCSSDDEDIRPYVNVPKINYVNDTDDPESIYENLHSSSKPKLNNNISPKSITFKDRQNLIAQTVHVQNPISFTTFKYSDSEAKSGCGHYDYPRTKVSNIKVDTVSTSRIDLEQQKGSILDESLYVNELGDSMSNTVYSDEPIYENTDDIFRRDKNLNDLIVRHHIHGTEETKPYNFDDELFFKSIDRNEAKEFLKNQPDGAFIFRPGDSFVILTVKYRNKIYNLLVGYTDRQTIVLNAEIENGVAKAPEFKNLTDFANYYMENPIIFEDGHIIVNIKLKPVVDLKQKNKSYVGGPTQSSLNSSILSDELAAKLSEALKLKISKDIENNEQVPTSITNFNRTPPLNRRDTKVSLPDSRNQYEYARISSTQDDVWYENLEMFRRTKAKNPESGTCNLNSEQFYRNTDRKGAKLLLENLPDRAFLIRPSDRYYLVLTIKYEGKIYNLGIDQTPEKRLRLDADSGNFSLEFDSLTELVTHFTQEQITFMHNGECLEIRLNPVLPANLF